MKTGWTSGVLLFPMLVCLRLPARTVRENPAFLMQLRWAYMVKPTVSTGLPCTWWRGIPPKPFRKLSFLSVKTGISQAGRSNANRMSRMAGCWFRKWNWFFRQKKMKYWLKHHNPWVSESPKLPAWIFEILPVRSCWLRVISLHF